MTYLPRVVAFGILAGSGWSWAPGILNQLLQDQGEALTVLASGMATGVVVSLLLYRPLLRVSLGGAALLGAVSLPLGAFVFAVTISVVHLLAQAVTGESYRFAEGGFEPILNGVRYAQYSVLYGLIPHLGWGRLLFPMAVLTTLCLQRTVSPLR
jgi:hypothetical protein